MIRVSVAGRFDVELALPPDLHVLPVVHDAATAAAVAEDLVRGLHPGLFGTDGEPLPGVEQRIAAARQRYVTTVALRRGSGALVSAVCAGFLNGEYTASFLTLNAVELPGDDPRVVAAGICKVLIDEGPADAEVMPLALPAGPAVGRVRRRVLRAGSDPEGDAQRMEVGIVDVHVVVPGENVLLVLDVVCPTPATFEEHAAMAGTVARSIVVTRTTEGAA